ncbi:serine racemase [Olea europaea var. sylvestris]|uniref:serine racemase n=1 Tax=Olea europaea var. sylvestris TaxID=158386 RepID=UPI000C1D56A3|nr:serine racemase [Olea europaea var. sylvestris]
MTCKMEANDRASSKKYAADISSIREAQERISSLVHRTPVLSSQILNSISGRKLHFKCECFQKGGAFKFRGACNAVFSLANDQATKGVVTHSSGNHAAALSLAAKLRGIPAYVVVPKNAPKCKVENVIRYGGQIFWSEVTIQSREEMATKVLQDTGAVLIHPFNDGRIISGQGTISLELLEQAPQIDTIIVPISGGGLISGVALAAKSINPAIRIYLPQASSVVDRYKAKPGNEHWSSTKEESMWMCICTLSTEGVKVEKISTDHHPAHMTTKALPTSMLILSDRIVTNPETKTQADGLQASLGSLTWPVVRDLVDDIILVSDKEIIDATKLCYEILKVAVEPSGAIGLAAVLSDCFKKNPAWKNCNNVGIIISGGNVDLGVLWDALNK